MSWSATVLTLFPEMFPGPLGVSLIGKARENGTWSLSVRDIREHGLGKHRTVDDTPAGGGPGMVMRADVAAGALDAARSSGAAGPLLYLTPRGRPLTQARVKSLAEGAGVTLLCGRFEGIDERVLETRAVEEISLGDFVLAGGEIAAMALIEACVRLLPRRSGRCGVHGGGKLRLRTPRIPPFHAAPELRGEGYSGCPNRRKSRGNCQVATDPVRDPDQAAAPRPLGPL